MAEAIQDTHELKRHLESWFIPQNNFMGVPELLYLQGGRTNIIQYNFLIIKNKILNSVPS